MIKHKFLTLLVALCATTALWASNTITYTATKKLTETTYENSPGLHIDAFNADITSHEFSNGVGAITFASEVTTIGDWAFYYCTGLTSITIPNSVTTIGARTFGYCYGLTFVDVDAANTHYVSIDGVLFNYARDTLIQYPASNSRTEYTIPNSVTTIEELAFAYCSSLTSITIPNSVTTIGERAFSGCSSLPIVDNIRYADTYLVEAVDKTLSTYTIKEGTKWIGDYAFYYCTGLTSITIPNSVTTIGDEAFMYCDHLTSVTIGNSVTTIGFWAFAGCSGLTSVAIPSSVTTIDYEAFCGCSGLTSVTIPNSVTTIGGGAFANCRSLISIDVDAANTHFVSVDGVLFNYAKDILIQCPAGNSRTEYTIPNSVTAIEAQAFFGCKNLISITIPNSVTTIGEVAFDGCSGLTSVTIPNSVTTIGDNAFEDCSSLTSITIPNSVTYIGSSAFYGCSGLTSITCEATIPPTCGCGCFGEVNKSIPLYVSVGSVDAYKAADVWRDFTDIRPITAKDVEVTEIEADPTESAVEIAWPSVVNAETYTIEIRLGDQLICSIVFNAEGQLVSINFNLAPGRGGHTYATTAEGTATGWAYTIAGLNPGTEYTYSVIAKNANDQVIDTKSGTFTTQGMPMDVESVHDAQCTMHDGKFLHNGQVLIQKNGKTFTILGQEIK